VGREWRYGRGGRNKGGKGRKKKRKGKRIGRGRTGSNVAKGGKARQGNKNLCLEIFPLSPGNPRYFYKYGEYE
jgi:hypothetical protein